MSKVGPPGASASKGVEEADATCQRLYAAPGDSRAPMRNNKTAVPDFSADSASRLLAVRSSKRGLPSISTSTAPAAPLRAMSAVAFSAASRSGACTLKQRSGSSPSSISPGGYNCPLRRRKDRTKKQGALGRDADSIAASIAPNPNRLAESPLSLPRISWQALMGSSLRISDSDRCSVFALPSAASAWPQPASGSASDGKAESDVLLFTLCSYRFSAIRQSDSIIAK